MSIVNRKYILLFLVFLATTACGESGGKADLDSTVIGIETDNYKYSNGGGVESELIPVKGGAFVMGDYGDYDKLSYSSFLRSYARENSTPEHKVVVSDFYISKYKISNEEFQYYLMDQEINLDYQLSPYRLKQWQVANSMPSLPAHMYWQDAYNYCEWLGKKTGLAFSLPTEAQWEYVVRNGGKRWEKNYSSSVTTENPMFGAPIAKNTDKKIYAEQHNTGLGYDQALPRDFYPPNMIGVSDLLNNGFEWMQDWFDYNYYAKSPELNPQGPEGPLQREEGNTLRIWRFKSVRGGLANFVVDSANARFGFPLEYPAELVNLTARCVVNQGSINHE